MDYNMIGAAFFYRELSKGLLYVRTGTDHRGC
jgi:hypothetical protein